VTAAPESLVISEQRDEAQEDSGASGTRRWRGRRRRRGGRGTAGSPEGQAETEESTETYAETATETEFAPEIHAAAGSNGDRPASQEFGSAAPAAVPTPRASYAPVPFVLPGESLSKYGGALAEEAPASAPASGPAATGRPSSTFKPSTLIEKPIEWDGSGLLPGESLSKHRARHSEPTVEGESQFRGSAPDAIEEEDLVEERTDARPEPAVEPAAEAAPAEPVLEAAEDHLADEEPLEEDQFEETTESAPEQPVVEAESVSAKPEHQAPENGTVETVIEEPWMDEAVAAPVTQETAAAEEPSVPEPVENEDAEAESERSASHNVDPLPPTGFRLFGFGGKKKEEEATPAPAQAKPAAASVPSVSAYAPGSGLIEEEVIEEEEFEAPRHHHGKAEEHDLDDFEEETLPNQMRTGDLGELLQEAHLDHRIQLNFDDKNGEDEDEEGFDEGDEDEEPSTEAQPAAGEGQTQQRRDRGGRGRRGRGGPAGQGQGNRRGPSRRSMQTSDLPIISDLLKPGQEILVQIAKEPIAKKGARITSHIALPGRFLVFMPTVTHIGVSRKIASDEERQRLKRILVSERGTASGGFIVRTAAEGASEEDLRADLRFLLHLWDEIKQRSESSKSPALIYHDLSLIERILRDQVSSNFSNIWVDSEADYERIVRFLNRFSPSLVRRVKLYTKELPLFEHFGIQDEISKALRSKVWLKSGGSIVINQTEALVAIDINTGKYVGKSARLEDTIVKTNLDAVPEIVRQIRLRDLGGIIVIDFIDMDDRKNRFRVLAALEEALKSDRAPTKVLQFNDFGLVAITRKRVKQSLERTLSVPCPTCQATGMVKSPTTVCNEIYTELRKMKKHFEGEDVLLRVNPETVKVLKSNNASWLNEFEELVGKNILVKSDPTLHPEQFDIQG
jgi:ribonuclease G